MMIVVLAVAGVVADSTHFVYGVHAVEAILSRRPRDIQRATILAGGLNGRLGDLAARLESSGVRLEHAARADLDRLARGGVHQGVVISVLPPQLQGMDALESLLERRADSLRLLVLDQVEDPRNLGACLRTADAVGIDAVIVPKARSAKLGGSALKAAAGAAETVPVIAVPNLARALRFLKDAGLLLVGTDERAGQSVFEAEFTPPVAIVLGAEGRGLRRLTREACDTLIRIPMQGTVESLNVSVAAGVVLYEMLRQNS